MRRFFYKKRGFTLIEILTICMIIAILAVLILPAFRKAFEKARLTDCMNNEKQFATMLQVYYLEWKRFHEPDRDSSLPVDAVLPFSKLKDQTEQAKKTRCPATDIPYLYEINTTRDTFTISCRPPEDDMSSHAWLGTATFCPNYTFEGGLKSE